MPGVGFALADYVGASLSTAGGCFMLLSYILFPKLQTSFGAISMWFAVCAIGYSTYCLMGGSREGSALCVVQAMIGTYFVLCSLLTSTILVHTIFRLFYPPRGGTSLTKLSVSRAHVAYAWGIPAVMAVLPATTGSYGQEDGDVHCWIDLEQGKNSTNIGMAMSFATFYVPVWMCIIYNVILCALIARKSVGMQGTTSASRTIAETANKCKWYPIIAVSCWSLRTVTRISTILGVTSGTLSSTGIALSYLHGFFDCLAYCHTTRVLSLWKARLQELFRIDEDAPSPPSSAITGSVRSHEMTDQSTVTGSDSTSFNHSENDMSVNIMHTESIDSNYDLSMTSKGVRSPMPWE